MTAASAAPQSTSDLTVSLDDPVETEQCTRWTMAADGRREAESSLQLAGMYCAACAGLIERALDSVPGVTQSRVVAASQRATVRWDPARTTLSALVRAVRAAGYDAVPDAAAPARELRRREQRTALWRLFVASFCAMQVMMLATPAYVASGDDLSADMRRLLNWGGWVLSLPVMGFCAAPFVAGAWRQMRAGRIGMDTPVALALLVTFIASMGATFDPGGVFGEEVYFDSLTMFLSFLLGGRYLELRARHRAAESLEAALARMPETCQRMRPDGSWETISVRRLARSDRVRIAAGQGFPADGEILEGSTRVDEALLTGESEPQPRQVGDAVVAGSINHGAPVIVRVDRVGADTRYEAIVAMMRSALSERPDAARIADRWASPFLWSVLGLAAAGALIWSQIDPARSIWVFVAVLIVTCPCALSLAAPAALVAAAGGLARRGVIFQRLQAIEALASATHAFVDKTGTLTEDRVEFVRMIRVGPAPPGGDQPDDAACLAIAASLAARSAHPVSKALAAAAPGPDPMPGWHEMAEHPGRGLEARDARGRRWRLGSRGWAGEGDLAPEVEARVWLSCDGLPVAAFQFNEVLREGALACISGLRERGLRVTLLTGDTEDRAAAVAARLGVDEVVASASPEDKLRRIRDVQAQPARVLAVGDGINDAPLLAQADVSLAMGQGALVSRSHADAVVASNRPADVVLARDKAVRTMGIIRQNLAWAAAYNMVCIPLALAGWLPPWAAGLGMALSSLAVIANAARAAR